MFTALQALGCRGVTRAGFRFGNRPRCAGESACIDFDAPPGATETSLVPVMAAHEGLSFGELVKWIVEHASLGR
ncbi:MAG TPA: hypothetical protein VH765_10535 [Xanthobacteraceae bacterium]